jgi:hypothetical protein
LRKGRAFRELVETRWGYKVYRMVDALNWRVRDMIWVELNVRPKRDYYWARDELCRRERAGRPKRLGKAFLKQINEQIGRAELIESERW